MNARVFPGALKQTPFHASDTEILAKRQETVLPAGSSLV